MLDVFWIRAIELDVIVGMMCNFYRASGRGGQGSNIMFLIPYHSPKGAQIVNCDICAVV